MSSFGIPATRSRFLSTYKYMRDPFGSYDQWKAKFGNTFVIRALNGDVYATCNRENVRRIFALPSDAIGPFAIETTRPLLGGMSVFLAEGEQHRKERSLLLPSFHGELIRETVATIENVAMKSAEKWKRGSIVRIMDSSLDISLEVILRVVFGLGEENRIQIFKDSMSRFVASFHPSLAFSRLLQRPLFGLSPWNKFVNARAEFDALIQSEIDQRKKSSSPSGNDLLSRLLDAKYDDGTSMTNEGIRDQLVTLLLAGHETTQIAIGWAMSWLFRNSKCLQRLRLELDEQEFSEVVSSSDLLTGICNESLRLNPILADVIRVAKKPIELEEVTVPVGKAIAPSTYLVHYDEELYPNPRSFEPDRWKDRTYKPHEFFPFGGGIRRCIGASLATMEMKIVIASWVKNFEFELLPVTPQIEPLHRRNLTMAPKSGIPLKFLGRRM